MDMLSQILYSKTVDVGKLYVLNLMISLLNI
jgi:hypothetical protein